MLTTAILLSLATLAGQPEPDMQPEQRTERRVRIEREDRAERQPGREGAPRQSDDRRELDRRNRDEPAPKPRNQMRDDRGDDRRGDQRSAPRANHARPRPEAFSRPDSRFDHRGFDNRGPAQRGPDQRGFEQRRFSPRQFGPRQFSQRQFGQRGFDPRQLEQLRPFNPSRSHSRAQQHRIPGPMHRGFSPHNAQRSDPRQMHRGMPHRDMTDRRTPPPTPRGFNDRASPNRRHMDNRGPNMQRPNMQRPEMRRPDMQRPDMQRPDQRDRNMRSPAPGPRSQQPHQFRGPNNRGNAHPGPNNHNDNRQPNRRWAL